MSSGAFGRYRRLLAEPGLRRLAAADLCARLPQGMLSITVLLVAARFAPMRVAGLTLAGATLGMAVTAPARGRLADRYGVPRVAAACFAGYLAAWLAVLLVPWVHRQPAALVGCAAVAGCLMPPLSPGLRSLWAARAPAPLLPAAFALDAALFDLAFIAGPPAASALATGIAPAAALGVLLALTGAALAMLGTGPPAAPAAPGPRRARGPLRSAALRRLLAAAGLANAALSATEVALTSSARLHHALWAAGPLLAGLSAGSIAGSLLLGARAPAAPGRGRLARLLAGYALGLAALTPASLALPALAVAAPLAGLCLGPALATIFTMAASAAPPGSATEAQAWLNAVMNGSAAAGAALAGLAAGRPVLGLALAAGAAALAALAAALSGYPGARR